MKYGIISDIHANLEALEVALDALSGEKIDTYLCVGDIVGYGADPALCIEKTKALRPVIVCGNHDSAAAGLTDTTNFNNAAEEAVLWTRSSLSAGDISFLRHLGVTFKNRHLTIVHGTLQEPESFHYMFDVRTASETFELMENNICFVGHSHMPGVFSRRAGSKIKYFSKAKIKLSADEKLIVNVGSIGQPRDGDPRLCYAVYDSDKGTAEIKRLPYDIKTAQKKIMDAGLPPFLAYRLAGGM